MIRCTLFGHKIKSAGCDYRLWIRYAPQVLKVLDKNFDEKSFYKKELEQLNTCERCGEKWTK